jgi:Transposase DDE domain
MTAWRRLRAWQQGGVWEKLHELIADRGYDHDKYRRLVWQLGVKPIIARRQTEHGSGLGRHRWVVERTFAWLHNPPPPDPYRPPRRHPRRLSRPRLLSHLLATAGELTE